MSFVFLPPFVNMSAVDVEFILFFLKGAAYIVTLYAEKLQEEQAWRSGRGIAPLLDTAGSKYAHVLGDDQIPLTGASYAHSDASHSFGSATSRHTTDSV